MNTLHANPAKLAPAPVSPEFALALPASTVDDDDDWLEFLSLGTPVDPTDVGVGAGWRHAPVLLSY